MSLISKYFDIPEVQAASLANKAQYADTLNRLKKAQRYRTGDIHDAISTKLVPFLCDKLEKTTKDDIASGLLVQINQYLLVMVLKVFESRPNICPKMIDKNANFFEKNLRLWWAYDWKTAIDLVKSAIQTEAPTNPKELKDLIKGAHKNLKGEKDKAKRYSALIGLPIEQPKKQSFINYVHST